MTLRGKKPMRHRKEWAKNKQTHKVSRSKAEWAEFYMINYVYT
jgi:hypothetical protein